MKIMWPKQAWKQYRNNQIQPYLFWFFVLTCDICFDFVFRCIQFVYKFGKYFNVPLNGFFGCSPALQKSFEWSLYQWSSMVMSRNLIKLNNFARHVLQLEYTLFYKNNFIRTWGSILSTIVKQRKRKAGFNIKSGFMYRDRLWSWA